MNITGIIIGWIGAVLYIAGYLLLSLNIIAARTVWYHTINASGAVGLIVNACVLNDNPNLFVNIVWLLIASISLLQIMKERNKVKEEHTGL